MDFTLNDLEKKEEDIKEQLKEIQTAIRVFKLMSGEKSKIQSVSSTTLNTAGEINLDELSLPKKPAKKISLNDEIVGVIDRLGSQEFTVTHIEAVLRQSGKGSDAKHFKNRIATNVKKLLVDGYLKRTFTGKGYVPHKYRRAATVMLSAKPTNISASTKIFGNNQE